MHNKPSLMFVLGAALLAFAACGDDGTTVGGDESHLSGRAGSEGRPSAGVTVEAHAVAADGTLTLLGDTTVGADGRYTIDVEVPASAVALELRTAEASAQAVMVSADELAAAGDTTLVVPPIDAAATFAADVYVSARTSGDTTLDLGTLDLMMSPALSAKLIATANHNAAVDAAADAAITAQAAWERALAIDAGGDATVAADAMLDAQLAHAIALDAAGTAAAAAAAYATYVKATVDGHATAGYDGDQLALAASAATTAMVNGTQSVAGTATAQLAVLQANATSASVDDGVVLIGGTDWSAVTTAGATLRTTAATAASDAAAMTAFATYQTAVNGAIAAQTQLAAPAMTALATDIDAAAVTLTAQLRAATTATAIVDALVAYRTAVASAAHLTVLTTAGVTAPGAAASLQVMADVEAATH